MSVFTDKQRNSIVLGVIVALACVIIYSLRELFNAFLGSIILYTLFKPTFCYLTKKIGKISSAVTKLMSKILGGRAGKLMAQRVAQPVNRCA